MTPGEIAVLVFIVAAFLGFSALLAWISHE
jgi:hypothetical protein